MRQTITLFALAFCFHSAARAGAPPTGFSESIITSTLASPTAMALAPDGRIFVCEQGGNLRVIKNNALLATPFIHLTVDSQGERGLLGVAFDPDFLVNHYVYLYYTVPQPVPHNRISRFTASGDVALPGSELPLLDLNNLSSATNHNGGSIHFGLDGRLYAGVGENANSANSQTLNNLLGKVLRINKDGSIPTDNPFYTTATGVNRVIWAMGLRNPFTFGVHPNSGRIFIDDVGESTWEEINDGIAGSNYGWPITEGPTTNPLFVTPLFAYMHGAANPGVCAVTGGTFYAPEVRQFPATYVESYFFADLCAGWIHRIDQTNASFDFAAGTSNPVDLVVAHDGSLYYLEHTGAVKRIRWDAHLKGDVNGDGTVDTADVFYLTNFLYGGGPPPVQGGDVDGNAMVNADDLTYLINYLLARGPTPAG